MIFSFGIHKPQACGFNIFIQLNVCIGLTNVQHYSFAIGNGSSQRISAGEIHISFLHRCYWWFWHVGSHVKVHIGSLIITSGCGLESVSRILHQTILTMRGYFPVRNNCKTCTVASGQHHFLAPVAKNISPECSPSCAKGFEIIRRSFVIKIR